jgi:hypothetical protein
MPAPLSPPSLSRYQLGPMHLRRGATRSYSKQSVPPVPVPVPRSVLAPDPLPLFPLCHTPECGQKPLAAVPLPFSPRFFTPVSR